MKTIVTVLSSLFITASALAQAPVKMSNAAAIELTAHRIDRLVTLGKIDKTFASNLDKIELTLVQNQPPYFYRSIVSQTKPTSGSPFQLEIFLDKAGSPLTYKVLPGGAIGPNLNWPGKNAATLAENSLHYVLENSTDSKIAPFFNGATSLTLAKVSFGGQDVARGQITSSATNKKLNVYLKFDGTFVSSEVVP